MEELHSLRNASDELHRGFLIVGDDERRSFMTVSTHDDLANQSVVIAQGNVGFVDQRIGERGASVSSSSPDFDSSRSRKSLQPR
jgi:hypothetical protein